MDYAVYMQYKYVPEVEISYLVIVLSIVGITLSIMEWMVILMMIIVMVLTITMI